MALQRLLSTQKGFKREHRAPKILGSGLRMRWLLVVGLQDLRLSI